jgi:hypothetical protein
MTNQIEELKNILSQINLLTQAEDEAHWSRDTLLNLCMISFKMAHT